MSNIRDQLHQFDFHDIMEISEDIDIQDMGDYVVVDNLFVDPDAVKDGLVKFPADSADEVKRLMYQQEQKPEFRTPNGITQLLPNQYFDRWFQELYKVLIEAEFVPHQVNEYLKDKQYLSNLSRGGLVTGILQHDNMVMHKRAHWPAPMLDFEYACHVFLGDDIDPENGISFYDLIFEGNRYTGIEDLAKIDNREDAKAIQDYLNVFVTVQPELEQFSPYEQTKYYDKTRFVEARKNRMVIFKSGKWVTDDYNGTGERYTFVTSLNVAKDQKQGTQEQDSAGNQSGQMQHGQMPPREEAQRWDSDY